MDREHEPVGYGNPPTASRFKPGQSGNPTGRPAGRKSFATLLREEGELMIEVTCGTQKKKMSVRQALAKRLYGQALNDGCWRSIKMILDHETAASALEDQAPVRFTLTFDNEKPLCPHPGAAAPDGGPGPAITG